MSENKAPQSIDQQVASHFLSVLNDDEAISDQVRERLKNLLEADKKPSRKELEVALFGNEPQS